jgi:hypothetical protein
MNLAPEHEKRINDSPFKTAAEFLMEELNAGRMDEETASIVLADILAQVERWEDHIQSIRDQMARIPAIERQRQELKDAYEQQKDALRDEYCRYVYGPNTEDPAERNLPPPRSREQIEESERRCEADYKAQDEALNNELSGLKCLEMDIYQINSRAASACRSLEMRIMKVDLGELGDIKDDLIFSASHPHLAEKRQELAALWQRFTPEQKTDFKNKMVAEGKWGQNELNELLAMLYLE